jgi:hypothetical protein
MLGSGTGSGYPNEIDTRQTFINSPLAAPDSASRIDAEFVNDSLHTLVQLETTLGARPQGNFASVAARLQQFVPGGGESPLTFGFAATTTVTIPGTLHNLGTASPLIDIYDNLSPRNSIEPNTISINTASYDIVVTFTTPQSGVICLANPVPQYSTTFTNTTSVSILGTSHGLDTSLLFASVYVVSGAQQIHSSSASVTIHTGTYDVLITFDTPQSGAVTLSAAGPRYSTAFTEQTSVTVFGATHGLGTGALLYQVYDNGAPRAFIEPNTLSIDQNTFDVVMTFQTPQSGTLLLVGATAISGQEFEIRDHGVTDVSAVRVYSELGTLHLQMGVGNQAVVESTTGSIVQTTDNTGNLVIAGEAYKSVGGPWLAPSDARLKTNVHPFTDGLDLLLHLEPVWFTFNGQGGIAPDGKEHVSLLAQAVQALAPYLVGSRPGVLEPGGPATDLLTLDTGPLLYVLINTLKTLYATQQTQEARLARLEALLEPPEEMPA